MARKVINQQNWRASAPAWMVQEIEALKNCKDLPLRFDCTTHNIPKRELSEDEIHLFADVLQISGAVNRLTEVNFGEQQLGDKGLEILLPTLLSAPKLHSISLFNTGITDASAPLIAELIRNKPGLRKLWINANQLTDSGLATISAALHGHPSIEQINISLTEVSPQGAMSLARALAHSPNLSRFQAFGDEGSELEKLAAAEPDLLPTLQRGHPNLFSIHVADLPEDDATRMNYSMANFLVRELVDKKKIENLSPDEVAQIAERFSAAREIMRISSFDGWKKGYRRAAQSERDWHALLETLPAIPEGEALSIESLTTPDEKGFTPLTNPANWPKFPAIIQALMEQNPAPSFTDLMQPMGNSPLLSGGPLLTYMLLEGPTAEIINALNKTGIRLQQNELLNADGTPNALFAPLITNGSAHTLFTKENWRGASGRDVSKALRALPPDMRESMPNRHTLFANMQRSAVRAIGLET